MSAGDADAQTLTAAAMKDPALLAALQEKLAGLEGMRSTFYDALPPKIKGRVNACRNIHKDFVSIEADFYREINALEQKYHEKYGAVYERRKKIIQGDYEPTEDECKCTDKLANGGAADEDADEPMDGIRLPSAIPDDAKGIPEFWLTVLKSATHTDSLIEPHDEPPLTKLKDLTLEYEAKDPECPDLIGFTLNFWFEPNDYFEETCLKKVYKLRIEPDKDEALTYEGPEIVHASGTEITWKKDKNVTKKVIKKKQKNKKTGHTRTTTSEVQQDSFFNYFTSIELRVENMKKHLEEAGADSDDEDDFDQQAAMLEADYEIGHFIRERLIPRAVLYYTGELDDEDSEYGDGEEDDDECDDDEEYDEDQDPDFDPSKVAEKPDCKQQ